MSRGWRLAWLLAIALPGCAAPVVRPPPAPAVPAPVPVLAVPAAERIPAGQRSAAIAGLEAALKAALPSTDTLRLVAGTGQPPSLVIDADRAFEVDSGQLKPALLLPLADAAAASRAGGAWVLHVVGRAPAATDADLAERRAAAVRAYLGSRGIAEGRLRAEVRSGPARRVEVHFSPVVQGSEAQAWMPPAAPAVR